MRFVRVAIRMPERRRAPRAFTLVELVAVIAASFAAYGWIRANTRARGKACGQNILLVESWKQQWKLDFPGAEVPAIEDANGLRRYAIGGVIPACPAGGAYSNLTSLKGVCACSLNWTGSEREARGSADPHEGEDRRKKGFHDPGY